MSHHDLRASAVTVGFDQREVLHEIDFAVPDGKITVIVGPNASGKSTLLRTLARLLRARSGEVTLDGVPLHQYRGKQLAAVVGLLPQQPTAPDGITVEELVVRGRYPRQGLFGQRTAADTLAVQSALAATDTVDLAERRVDELSGGQRQRVWVAMALAQQTDILLLDEPTTFLDVTHQIEVLDLLVELNRRASTTIVMVLHDLNLAARYADHMIVMSDGRIVAEGDPHAVVTREVVREAFALEALIVPDPVAGSPMVVPIGRFHSRDSLD